MEKKMTAMEELKNKVMDAIEYIKGFPGEYYQGQESAWLSVLDTINEESLPKEREQIEEAFTMGQKEIIDVVKEQEGQEFPETTALLNDAISGKQKNENASDYFTQTYGKG